MRALLLLLVAVSLAQVALAQVAISPKAVQPAPAQTDVEQLVQVSVYATTEAVQAWKSSGAAISGTGPYYKVTARAFVSPDGGKTTSLPQLPTGAEVLSVAPVGACTDPTLCKPYVSSGLDPVSQGSLDCACAVDATCQATPPGGGKAQAAPLGQTLGPGYQWTSPTGPGCVPKACIELWTDGGDSWQPQCPLK
jgi:hypothetical protein